MLHTFKFGRFVDETRFKTIFLFWIVMIVFFGIIYFLLSLTPANALVYGGQPITGNIAGLFDSVYFSFITATTLGYGDIAPRGLLKFFSIVEAVFGLLIFGVVISKLMSSKQDVVLEEIYDIAFEENIDRLRSALYLFREDVNKIINKIEHKTIAREEIADLWMMMTTFDTALLDIYKTLCPLRRNRKDYYKKVEGVRLELLFNSIRLSIAKLAELVHLLNKHKLTWQNSTIVGSITADLGIIGNILTYYKDHEETDKKNAEKLKEIRRIKETLQEQLNTKVNTDSEEKPAEKEATETTKVPVRPIPSVITTTP